MVLAIPGKVQYKYNHKNNNDKKNVKYLHLAERHTCQWGYVCLLAYASYKFLIKIIKQLSLR